MKNKDSINLDYVKSILEYDEETGIFIRKPINEKTRMDKTKNTRWSLKEAGTITPYGYKAINIDHTVYLAHRLAWFYVNGEWPTELDHINGNKLDNKISNLRIASSSQNKRNRPKQANNKSGYKGVCFYPPLKKWHAQIHINRKRIHLGYFKCPTAAHFSYIKAAKELHGEYARFE